MSEIEDKGLKEAAERLVVLAKERDKNSVIQLPLWPEKKRGTPNAFIRSALFPAIQGQHRQYLEETELFSQQGITVKFTGKQLNQEDLTLWETLVHLARNQPLGDECTFTAYGILKAMGLPKGGAQHKRLHSGIIRLMACAVSVTHEGKTYIGSLIEDGAKDEISKIYNIKLNRKMINLYGETQYTSIDWEQRLSLRRKPLAQALHVFYSSHKKPYPQKIETLALLTGSRNKQKAGFKVKLCAALDELQSIGFLSNWRIENELVFVERVAVLPSNI